MKLKPIKETRRDGELEKESLWRYFYKEKGKLDKELIKRIVKMKGEPKWMEEFRLVGLKTFEKLKLPDWAGDLGDLNWQDISYYLKPLKEKGKNWAEVPEEIKMVFDKLGIPEAEKEVLAGVETQFDSEVIYGSLRKEWKEKGVVFTSMDEGVKKYPEIVRKYMGKVIGVDDNKLAALNSAVWSGGSFVYVPAGVEVSMPVQAYFRMNKEKAGQFERTLIVAEEGSKVHYVEGCSAPVYSSASLHAGVVEVIVKKGARVEYTTVQNWYKNVFNLVTKRAHVEEEGEMRWVDGNLGSRLTMKYPSCILAGRKARGEMLSVAWAGKGQHQDSGAKMIHLAPETSSLIMSKSVSKDGGKASYRGLVRIDKGAVGAKARVECDALILDEESKVETYPVNMIGERRGEIEHEARVSRLSKEKLFYLMSRGISEEEAEKMMVNGFLESVIKEIPLEYAAEMNKLINLEMEGSVA